MAPSQSMLVVSAHAADFVWRAAGAIALHTAAGGTATVVCLSYGERGESGDLWREPGQTVAAVKARRHAEGEQAAAEVGADYVPLDLGDYPLAVPESAMRRLVEVYLRTRPDVLLVHAPADPFNPDHPVASAAAVKARLLAMGAGGVPAAFPTIPPPGMFAFEPHQPDQCGFTPDTYLDVTAVFDRKLAAMGAMASQAYLADHYRQRAEQRAYQSRYLGAGAEVRYVEAFQRMAPELRDRL
ncbi:PIG-L deacetylase family protein [Acrocarpospora catenulata]|uniref:PIG-L deacetylase family protein n=1 Tax=Acrocarpospora catenulata TaxID=2836182 RepID=UPI001BDB0D6F|nr:PIG-L deacetylase family protein [Acrocarpospora catenulata]